VKGGGTEEVYERLRELAVGPTKRGFKRARWSTIKEVEILVELAAPYEQVLESGTANGWSAAWFATTGKKVTTFDPHKRLLLWDHFMGIEGLSDKITCVTGKFAGSVLPYLPSEPAMYFFDGGHRYASVREDFLAVKEQEGLFVFHDSKSEFGVVNYLKKLESLDLYTITYHECERGITSVRKKDA
jgi:hypothetical protein